MEHIQDAFHIFRGDLCNISWLLSLAFGLSQQNPRSLSLAFGLSQQNPRSLSLAFWVEQEKQITQNTNLITLSLNQKWVQPSKSNTFSQNFGLNCGTFPGGSLYLLADLWIISRMLSLTFGLSHQHRVRSPDSGV